MGLNLNQNFEGSANEWEFFVDRNINRIIVIVLHRDTDRSCNENIISLVCSHSNRQLHSLRVETHPAHTWQLLLPARYQENLNVGLFTLRHWITVPSLDCIPWPLIAKKYLLQIHPLCRRPRTAAGSKRSARVTITPHPPRPGCCILRPAHQRCAPLQLLFSEKNHLRLRCCWRIT